ncbi:acyl-CoA N-acyltransferase [Trametes sanguinea]|nr:acyl-CoA N-acyltransferase [Trametes sanguinea]
MVTSKVVRLANLASPDDIVAAGDIPATITLKDKIYTVRVVHAQSLSAKEQKLIWSLYEANMRAMTEPSSFGWNPSKKKKELFHRNARYILAYAGQHVPPYEDTLAPAAFSMFRFERDQGEDLLYCYELQVAEASRSSGLGRFLVDKLTAIGKAYGMEKVTLTVLKSNKAARRFYEQTGFVLDPSSPDYESSEEQQASSPGDDELCDYEILSKALTS